MNLRDIVTAVLALKTDEKGAALVEYGMLVGLIALACVVSVTLVGTDIAALMTRIATALAAVAPGG